MNSYSPDSQPINAHQEEYQNNFENPEEANRQSLEEIIKAERIDTIFQPIFDLQTAQPFGYEALSRVVGASPFLGPTELFKQAQKFGQTLKLEKICLKKAIANARRLEVPGILTLNISPTALKHPQGESKLQIDLVNDLFDMRNEIVLELTERVYIEDTDIFKQSVEYYRNQGFRIAIDDLGAGYAGLNMLSQFEPYMVKIDRFLVWDIHISPKKQMLLESIVSFCHKINALVVVEGVENAKDLETIMSMKVDLAQGFFLARPQPKLQDCSEEAAECILLSKRKTNSQLVDCNFIGTLAQPVEPISAYESVAKISEKFKKDPTLTSVPLVDRYNPIGIVHKNKLFYKLGQRFGYDLFSGKSAKNISENALIFESSTPLEEVSRKVLSRSENSIYDAVIVVHNGVYLGIVKVHHLLERITEQKVNLAMQANPLTGLPGNNLIKEEIEKRLSTGQIFAAMYFDLDNFKPFNDNFGFEQGDRVIRFVGTLLKDSLHEWDLRGFVGHVGGDDFVVICRAQDIEGLSDSILKRFEEEVKTYHDEETRRLGYYESHDRLGNVKRFPLLSMSIAVVSSRQRVFKSYGHLVSVASEVKKKAKSIAGNSYYIDKRTS